MGRFGLLLAITTLGSCHPTEDPLLAEAKKSLADKMKDPSSVQFRNVKLCETKGMVTGEANAKNSFGAYTGFEPFVYANRGSYTISSLPLALEPETGGKYLIHLINVCYQGGDPSFNAFLAGKKKS
jgi:hypothetical protein